MSFLDGTESEGKTLVDRIKFWGETDPDTPAFIFWGAAGRRVLTRGEVLDLSSRFASRLAKRGVMPGDVVCIALPNCPERVVAEYGVQLAGAVSVNGQILRADGHDFIEVINKAKCKMLVLDFEETNGPWHLIKKFFELCKVSCFYAEVRSYVMQHLTNIMFSPVHGKADNFFINLNMEEKYICECRSPQDVATLFTTSGTTGYAKLVPHTHTNALIFGFNQSHFLSLQPGSRFLNPSPLGWISGYPSMYLFSGCTRIAIDEHIQGVPQKPAYIWDVICKEQVETAYFPPSVITTVHQGKSSSLLQEYKLRRIFTAGSPVKRLTVKCAFELSDSLILAYGSTETGLISMFDITSGNYSDFEDFGAGFPLDGVSVKLVDDKMNTVLPLSRGEVLAKTTTLCQGYIGADVKSKNGFLPDGWFKTGDVGYMRDDGCLFVEGRSSDVIMHGAFLVYPSWLEKKLLECPGVKDVLVVPVPDEVLHHEICACVKLDDSAEVPPSAQDVIDFSQKQTVLDEKSVYNVVPKYVVFLKDIPLTKNGKPDRKQLTSLAKSVLKL